MIPLDIIILQENDILFKVIPLNISYLLKTTNKQQQCALLYNFIFLR